MLADVTIVGFRAFRKLHVDRLARVNLFVGANNAGKTSILEAIELLALGVPWGLWRSPLRRGEEVLAGNEEERPVGRSEVDVSHLFFGHKLEPSASFSLRSSAKPRRFLECHVVEPPPGITEGMPHARLPLDEPPGPFLAISLTSHLSSSATLIPLSPYKGIPLDVRRRYLPSASDNAPPVHFLRPETSDAPRLGVLWDRVVLTPEERHVVEALQLIEPKLERIAFLGDDRRYTRNILLKLSDSDRRLPLGSAGDGLKRLLALALHLIPAQGGYLFVDEIDTGLHFSVMTDMWRLVIDTATRLDVQIFATTHSLDCVLALAWVREKLEIGASDVALHRVERGVDHTVAYTPDEILTAARHNLEVR